MSVITDAQGKPVRQLTGPTTPGLHRIPWELRRSPQAAGDTESGHLVKPGKYTNTLHSVLAASLTMLVWAADPAAETALAPGPATPANPAETQTPLVLKIAVNDIYCRQTACECLAKIATREYAGLVEALQKNHKITLQMTYFMEVFDLEKAIRAKSHDGVICKPWTALRLAKEAGADFKRVADIRDLDNSPVMTGVFLTNSKSPLKSLDDLNGKRIAFGQQDSYEKNHAPLQMLAAKGVQPGECLYQSSCGENLDALMNGKVEVAVVSSYALTASCAVDFAKPEDFKTIASTPEMPLTSLLLDLRRVAPANAVRLQNALLDLSGDKVPKDLQGKGFVRPASWKPRLENPEKPVNP
ncbi:MAG: PhnD/SsuA/transferrin family substrate-binding protein [Verrucomicrobia bacterium]|nr:PhnD/SsuA/transferrin family substrate-binding protein [Verrucomicrobiota bacterium]